MGQSQSENKQESEKQNIFKNLNKDYKCVGEEHDLRYGSFKKYVLNADKSQSVAVINRTILDEMDPVELKSEIEIRSKFFHHNLLNLLGWKVNLSNNLCGNFGGYEICFPYLNKTLAEELQRRNQKQVFPQNIYFYQNK